MDAGIDVTARNYKHGNRQDAGRWKMTGSDNPKQTKTNSTRMPAEMLKPEATDDAGIDGITGRMQNTNTSW